MRKNNISEVIGKISEKYISEATAYAGNAIAVSHIGWKKLGAIAACFMCAFIISLATLLPRFHNEDSTKQGIVFLTDQEPIIVSIEKWQNEGFQCKVIDPDIHEFLVKGGTLLILFTTETRITALNGEEFIYDDQNSNAEDCGLPIGTVVKIYFDTIEYGENNMADRMYAKEVMPYTSNGSENTL